MTKAIEAGMPKLRIEEAATRRQARIDRGEDVVVGVNKYQAPDDATVPVREIDNTRVREAQIERLKHVRAERDETACRKALDALVEMAQERRGQSARGRHRRDARARHRRRNLRRARIGLHAAIAP